MTGKLHITTLFGPRDRAGSSVATESSGVGENQPSCAGCAGLLTSIAWSPPECQESRMRCRRAVGSCDEYEVANSVAASSPGLPWNGGEFWKILYSPTIEGADGFRTFINRTQPHGQPKLGAVSVP